jgi:hypothetical protein
MVYRLMAIFANWIGIVVRDDQTRNRQSNSGRAVDLLAQGRRVLGADEMEKAESILRTFGIW